MRTNKTNCFQKFGLSAHVLLQHNKNKTLLIKERNNIGSGLGLVELESWLQLLERFRCHWDVRVSSRLTISTVCPLCLWAAGCISAAKCSRCGWQRRIHHWSLWVQAESTAPMMVRNTNNTKNTNMREDASQQKLEARATFKLLVLSDEFYDIYPHVETTKPAYYILCKTQITALLHKDGFTGKLCIIFFLSWGRKAHGYTT